MKDKLSNFITTFKSTEGKWLDVKIMHDANAYMTYIYYKHILTMVCGKTKARNLLRKTKNLLTTTEISRNLQDEIIDTDLTTIRRYMDDEAWEAFTKQGIYIHECHTLRLLTCCLQLMTSESSGCARFAG